MRERYRAFLTTIRRSRKKRWAITCSGKNSRAVRNMYMNNKTSTIQWAAILKMPIAIFLSLFIGFIITLFVSEEPFTAYYTLLTGPFSYLNRFGDWIEDAITLTLLGLTFSIFFSAKQICLGAEGQMTLGALTSGL